MHLSRENETKIVKITHSEYIVGENAPISRVSVFLLPLCPPKFVLSPIQEWGRRGLIFRLKIFPPAVACIRSLFLSDSSSSVVFSLGSYIGSTKTNLYL